MPSLIPINENELVRFLKPGHGTLSCLSAPRNFIVTAHAQKRAAERGITKADFIETILRPNGKRKQRHGEHGGIVYLFSRRFGARELHISAEIFKSDCFLSPDIGNDSSKYHSRSREKPSRSRTGLKRSCRLRPIQQ